MSINALAAVETVDSSDFLAKRHPSFAHAMLSLLLYAAITLYFLVTDVVNFSSSDEKHWGKPLSLQKSAFSGIEGLFAV